MGFDIGSGKIAIYGCKSELSSFPILGRSLCKILENGCSTLCAKKSTWMKKNFEIKRILKIQTYGFISIQRTNNTW